MCCRSFDSLHVLSGAAGVRCGRHRTDRSQEPSDQGEPDECGCGDPDVRGHHRAPVDREAVQHRAVLSGNDSGGRWARNTPEAACGGTETALSRPKLEAKCESLPRLSARTRRGGGRRPGGAGHAQGSECDRARTRVALRRGEADPARIANRRDPTWTTGSAEGDERPNSERGDVLEKGDRPEPVRPGAARW